MKESIPLPHPNQTKQKITKFLSCINVFLFMYIIFEYVEYIAKTN